MGVRSRRRCAVAVLAWCCAVAQRVEARRTLESSASEIHHESHNSDMHHASEMHHGTLEDHDGAAPATGPNAETLALWRALAPELKADAPLRLSASAKASLGLVEELDYEEFVDPLCHMIAHAIGAKMYEALGSLDAALAACGYKCTGGCLHGAIKGFVGADKVGAEKRSPALLRRAWAVLAANERMGNLTTLGETAHSFGHTLVLAGLSKSEALAFCAEGLGDGAALAHYCSGGVYMQTGSATAPKQLPDRVVACAKAPPSARPSCFYYGLRRSWRACACCTKELPQCPSAHCGKASCKITAAEDASGGAAVSGALLGLCADLRGGVRQSCLYGVASAATFGSDAYRRVNSTSTLCDAIPEGADRRACLDGLVFRASKYFRTAALEHICPRLASKRDRDFCLGVSGAGMYSLDDFKKALLQSYAEDDTANATAAQGPPRPP
mmetsp:Transcript_17688/g.62891  ORF Transcript_17688/g.62891 Transcript_17688/m.62891 type:complete len:442 (-) Transcript_17688:32-1357(-)